jgi:hypothetical protein
MVVLRGTKHSGLYEMVGMVESASTIISAVTPTCSIIKDDDMTGCSGAATVETCQMTVSVIA